MPPIFSSAKQKRLSSIYTNPKAQGSLRGPKPLYDECKRRNYHNITLQDCKDFLHTQPAYVEYKQRRVNFSRNITDTLDLGTIQIDLAFMNDPELVAENNGFAYVIFAYEEFSKFVWGACVRDKGESNVVEFLAQLLENTSKYNYQLRNLFSDRGTEFTNATLRAFLKKRKIHQYFSYSEVCT